MRLLVVEDEIDLARTLRRALEEEAFSVDLASDGEDALFKATEVAYDAVILDVMLPGLDGWGVLTGLRQAGRRTPVLVLTARDEVENKVRGFDLGADDYLTKPFELAELIARVRALIRRAAGHASAEVAVGDMTIDTAARIVRCAGRRIDLTAREYAILELMMRHRGALVTRSEICEHVYNEDADVASNVVDVHVSALRRKLGRDIIQTRRGHGYWIDA